MTKELREAVEKAVEKLESHLSDIDPAGITKDEQMDLLVIQADLELALKEDTPDRGTKDPVIKEYLEANEVFMADHVEEHITRCLNDDATQERVFSIMMIHAAGIALRAARIAPDRDITHHRAHITRWTTELQRDFMKAVRK